MIRLIEKKDNPFIAKIIRTVMPEFGAGGKGFAVHDPEVNDMFSAFSKPRTRYYVTESEGRIVGGGGIAPLEGGDPDHCELKKMYSLPEARGKGYGYTMVNMNLAAAREFGFLWCYLETFNTMKDAMRLYERMGFEKIQGPLGCTGHFGCDTYYKIDLKN